MVLNKTRRGVVRKRVNLGVALGIAAAAATLGALQPARAQEAAPPAKAENAAPTCKPLPMNDALERQFKDIAPGVPFQAGGDPVQKLGRPDGKAAIIHMVIDQMGFIRGQGGEYKEDIHTTNRLRFCGSGQMVEGGQTYQVSTYLY